MTFRILHVDDDSVFRDFVQAVFAHEEKYQVVSRKHVRDALASIEDVAPNLVITDIMMPDKGGLEFVHELRQMAAFEQIPVFLLSARSRDLEKYASLGENAAVILSKPIEPDVLRSKVKSQLEQMPR
ncbi:MAG: response regulator [Roseovarius sp.]|uniref:response regulator n=1 Tax=Roseovarius sp. TaxID=1486281 RepID=UPI0032EEE15A